MQPSVPIQSQILLNLTAMQVDPQYLKFGVTNLESDQYICIRDATPSDEQQLTIIEMFNNNNMTRQPNKAEAAIMHPAANIIGLKAPNSTGTGCIVQVFNMNEKKKLSNVEVNDKIVYWHWVNNKILAYVTSTSVYHINIEAGESAPAIKILDRSGPLAEQTVQIIGYNLEVNEKWCSLYGISTPDGGKTILGHIQLFLIEGAKQQLLEGHCTCFGESLIHSDDHLSSIFCFFERKSTDPVPKIHITEIGAPPSGVPKHKKQYDFPVDPSYPSDFPVYMQVSGKYGVLFAATKYGFLYGFELTTAAPLFRIRISEQSIFIGAKNSQTDGIITINKAGAVISNDIDPANYIPHILRSTHIPDNATLGFKLAIRFKLPGVEGLLVEQFNKLLVTGDFAGAAQIAAGAPGTLIRNNDTINKFKGMQGPPGTSAPLLIYFQTLLEKGGLNKIESLELTGLMLSQNRQNFVEEWVKNNKLEASEELGDLIKKYDSGLALEIYRRCNVHGKVVQALMELGRTDEAMKYSQSTGTSVDVVGTIRNAIATNPESALTIAQNLYAQNPNINVHGIAEIFMQTSRFQEMTAFLVECMKGNRPEDGPWQTKVLEFNLSAAPQVAETILQMGIWNQYNQARIAALCEQKFLFQRALENYSDLKDIRRVVLNTQAINVEWLVGFIGKMQSEWILACMQDMLRHNRNNVQLIVRIATLNNQNLGFMPCVKIFESIGAYDGIFLFLGAVINSTEDQEVYYKFIEAASKCNQLREVERVIKEKPNCYDPVKVKTLLFDLKLPDPKPLIFLCDIHDYVDELTQYLYKNNFNKYIEIYLFKVNPNATPKVLGSLIDLECDEVYIKQILYNIRGNCPIEPLIEEFEKRNKIRVLENWLDSRVAEGNQIPSVHNALAKIKVDINQDPENFLSNNQFYDPKVIGKFCEERDPHLAVIAYKRSWGTCDQELIEVTNRNSLFRLQARYLVERLSKELWAEVLTPENTFRAQVIEQVISAALPESKNVDEVSVTVSAFLKAGLQLELISLLEKIVLHNSEFGGYKQLQSLLIITAVKSDQSRVMDYINRLDNYDPSDMATECLDYNLNEEALFIYRKFNMATEAVDILLNRIGDVNRAAEFAEKVNTNEVWSRLGNAYIGKFQVADSMDCFMRSKDVSQYSTIIGMAENEGQYEHLIKYLLMCRELMKDSTIDNALAFAYAKLSKNTDLETLINNANSVDAQRVGDRCYEDKLYEAAKSLYVSIKNNAKIASCLVRLKQFQAAIDSAKKANTPKTWKELCMACVEAGEFRLASIAGMNIIIHPDHLDELIRHYQELGYPEEMISLLESGMTLDRAHVGIYTELGVLFAKYKPEKLMEHIRVNFQKLNVSKLLRICERFLLWSEAVYLHSNYDEYDNAINLMIEHSPIAWSHDNFLRTIQKAANNDLYYKSVLFYLEEQPQLINQLLKTLSNKIDISKLVTVMKQTGYFFVIQPFLKTVQNVNNKDLNEALNELYYETEDHENLRASITQFESFDQLALAQLTEKHELLEFRRIASYLYRRQGKYDFSIALSKQDEQYRDAIETAQESQKQALVEDLLKFFVTTGNKEFFTVCCYTCFDLLRPDVVLEYSWRAGFIDFAMPYFIQVTRDLTHRVETVQKKHETNEQEEQKKNKKREHEIMNFASDLMMPGLVQQGMLMPPPNMMQGMAPPNMMNSGFGGQPNFGQPNPYGSGMYSGNPF